MRKWLANVGPILGIGVIFIILFTGVVLNAIANSCARRTVVKKCLENPSQIKDLPPEREDILLSLSAHGLYQDIGMLVIFTILLIVFIWGLVKISRAEYFD